MTVELGFIHYGGDVNKLREVLKLANVDDINSLAYEPCGRRQAPIDPDWWIRDNENRKCYRYQNYVLYTGDFKECTQFKYILYIEWDEDTHSTFILF